MNPDLAKHLDSLRFQSDQAYTALKRAIDSVNHVDAVWAHDLYQAFGTTLEEAIGPDWQDLPRAEAQAAGVHQFLMQYAVGAGVTLELARTSAEPFPPL